jgi:hypothetical protein
MQKIWRQIGMHFMSWTKIDDFKRENHLKTDGEAIAEAFSQLNRFKIVMRELEKRAQESEQWRERANKRVEEGVKNEIESGQQTEGNK